MQGTSPVIYSAMSKHVKELIYAYRTRVPAADGPVYALDPLGSGFATHKD